MRTWRARPRPAAGRGSPDRPRASHRTARQARARAGAVLLPRDDRGDGPVLPGARVLRRWDRRAGPAHRSAGQRIHGLVRRHLGVVFDICHQSVQFEDIAASLRLLYASGVPIFKLQAAAALVGARGHTAGGGGPWRRSRHHLPEPDDRGARRRADPLPQPLRRDRCLADRSLGQPGVAHALPRAGVPRRPRRVPARRRSGIEAALQVHAETPLSDHLEIETYTWDVLPGAAQDRRHHRLRLPRARVAARRTRRRRRRAARALPLASVRVASPTPADAVGRKHDVALRVPYGPSNFPRDAQSRSSGGPARFLRRPS